MACWRLVSWGLLALVLAVAGPTRLPRGWVAAEMASRHYEDLSELRCLGPYRREVADRSEGLHGLQLALGKWSESSQRPPAIFHENFPIVLNRQKVTVCMVEKCGSSRFKLLFLRGMGYTPTELLSPSSSFKPHAAALRWVPTSMETYLAGLSGRHRPRVIVVRCPYSRLLSAFLNKVFCRTCKSGSQAEENAIAYVQRLKGAIGIPLNIREYSAVEGFQVLVKSMHSAFLGNGRRAVAIDPHFAPIHHLCLLSHGFKYDLVLKLEEMDSWYYDFLVMTGLEEAAASGWHINSYLNVATPGQPCFYRPDGVDCGDIPRLSDSCSAAAVANSTDAPAQTKLQRSASGATDLMEEFYSPELAAMITEIFGDDLEGFGYRPWGGTGEYNPVA